MAVTAWVLIQTDIGKARPVAEAIAAIKRPGLRILAADTVTGPHDVIAHVEATDLEAFNTGLEATVDVIPGVEHRTTCMAFHAR